MYFTTISTSTYLGSVITIQFRNQELLRFQITIQSRRGPGYNLVSRDQTTIFAQGRYRFQYKRSARIGSGTVHSSDIQPI